MSLDVLARVHNVRRQRLFVRLSLENLLLDGARSNEAIHEAVFLLTVTPDSSERLLVCRWIPIRVEENEAIGTDQVQATTTSFAAEQENKFLTVRIVELVDQLLAFITTY